MRCFVAEDRLKLMIVSRKRHVLVKGREGDSSANTTYGCPTLKLPEVGKNTRNECSDTSILHKIPSRFVPSYSSSYAIESPMVSRIPLVVIHNNIPSVEQQLISILKCPSCEVVAVDDERKRVLFQPTVVVQYFDNEGPICARRGLLHKDTIRRRRVRSSGFRRCSSAQKPSLVVSAAKRAGIPPAVPAVTGMSSSLPPPVPPPAVPRSHSRSVSSIHVEGHCASDIIRCPTMEFRVLFGKR